MRLRLEDVSVEFSGHRVLSDVCMTIDQPELVALLGPSGAGKSTLLNVIAGIQAVSSGRRVLESTCREGEPGVRVGWIFQSCPVFSHRTAVDNVAIGGLLAGVGRHSSQESAARLLRRFGLDHVSNVRARRLSGGERQRVAVCRSLAASPDLLLADEPTASLDLTNRQLVRDALLEAASIVPVIMATHDASMANAAQRHLVITDGRLH